LRSGDSSLRSRPVRRVAAGACWAK
jgi:hypothetical protein